MAVPPDPNESFLREVDEGLRRDQAIALWKRWGRVAIVAIVVGLIALAGGLYWNHHRATVRGVEGEQLQAAYDALGANKPADAQKALAALAKSDGAGYRAMAQFAEADIMLAKDDVKGAVAKFSSMAADESLPQPFRELARVRQTASEFDTLKPQTAVDRLRPLAAPGKPWFASAGELVAVAYLRLGRRDLAGDLFGKIAREENAPPSIRQRAVEMAGVLGVDAVGRGEGSK